MFCIDSVDIDSIECIRDPCLVSTVSTYIVLMVWLMSGYHADTPITIKAEASSKADSCIH